MTTTKRQRNHYDRFRNAGYSAKESLRNARIVCRFSELESEGLVRIEGYAEQENYFDVYGKPEAYTDQFGRRVSEKQATKELEELLELKGCWWVKTEFRESDDAEWEQSDSIGMCAGYDDPCSSFENCYVVDLMRSAIDELETAQSDRAEQFAEFCDHV